MTGGEGRNIGRVGWVKTESRTKIYQKYEADSSEKNWKRRKSSDFRFTEMYIS